eukprot:15442-Heterococcus_DN1.PRE.1
MDPTLLLLQNLVPMTAAIVITAPQRQCHFLLCLAQQPSAAQAVLRFTIITPPRRKQLQQFVATTVRSPGHGLVGCKLFTCSMYLHRGSHHTSIV